MIKLDDQSQTLFLFKEMSIYNKMSYNKNIKKLQNLMLNSISHNLYTPINALIQLNKNLGNLLGRLTEPTLKVINMIGVCL